ncbi:pectinesterase-like [Magnolia sinica]|uniref:pectinesterase-like n=1 Tax=Magnolia sinica TaxID=86752 RepID=UPI0026586A65|nr:pectinesterase-like [Magnolia sinica]
MSAFDFGHLSERRRAEREAKKRKRIAIGLGITLTILILLASGAFAVAQHSKHATQPRKTTTSKANGANAGTKEIATSSKVIKLLCNSTDYKTDCESTLKNATGSDPKDLIKASIKAVAGEVKKGFAKASQLKTDDPKVKGAIADCNELLDHAKDELESTIANIDGEKMSSKSNDLKNWMSAVMSYQQTCIDGFPEGDLKSKMEDGMKSAKKMTSNALAIINEAASILSTLEIPGFTHPRLLQEESSNGGLPDWMSTEDRRLLKEKAKPPPNVVVAKDGKFTTINAALKAMPKKYTGRYVIYVKEGIYEEQVIITKDMVNVTIYGDGSRKTIVTSSKNFVDGTRTFQTATFAAIGDGFMAQDIGFRNSAGAIKHQAVALRVQSDRSVFLNCRMEGYQDTLYVQTHRQFYRSCVIAGTIDFIFGDAAAVFQNCQMVVRKPLDNQQNIVTAQGRVDRHQSTGIVIQKCKIQPDKKLIPVMKKIKSYLGRPWKEYSRTIVMETTIGDLIHPDGWLPWEGDFALKTLEYGEYNNDGPGAAVSARVKWPGYKVINKQQALTFTVEKFIQGREWIKAINSGTPVRLTLFN